MQLDRSSALLFVALAALGSGACDLAGSGQQTESASQPIFGGTAAANPVTTGVVRIDGTTEQCSAVIYSQYWVITAAHCFEPWRDMDSNGVITAEEGAVIFTVRGVVDPNGAPRDISAWRIYRHPNGAWGSAGAAPSRDFALVFLDPGSFGAWVSYLPQVRYTYGRLNIYDASLANMWWLQPIAWGYGPDAVGGSWGTLRSARKEIRLVQDDNFSYWSWRLNNAGTGCSGDSGGPDFTLSGWGESLLGVHSRGDCSFEYDVSVGAPGWRDFLGTTTSTCPAHTQSGACHF